jgi:hypothetical protein
MTLTKLQTLYRAAVAAEPSVAIDGVTIDVQHGGWYVLDKETNTHATLSDFLMFLELFDRLGCGQVKSRNGMEEKSIRDEVFEALERIARKEAK